VRRIIPKVLFNYATQKSPAKPIGKAPYFSITYQFTELFSIDNIFIFLLTSSHPDKVE
jgi:hypothetical protein